MSEVGQITYLASIDTTKMSADAKRVEGIANQTGRNLGDGVDKGASKASLAFGKLAKAAKVATLAAGASLAAGLTLASKASWDQVNSVQQAAAMLGRYYDSADDVTKVQQELIKYAQSDMGVLFNRKDLFQAAGSLAMYGSSAEDVTKQVAILSRGMASNVLTWDEMNAVVGRVVSSGKLSRMEFEMLAKAGYNIDKQFVNTNVTTEEFFKILDNSIPKDISQDMNNIVPVGIRLQTAFRNIGNAILGVNELQDGFLAGSLGERLINAMKSITQIANDLAPTLRQVMTNVIDTASKVWTHLQPAFSRLGSVIMNEVIPAFNRIVSSRLAQVLGATLVFAVGLAVQALSSLLSIGSRILSWSSTYLAGLLSLVAGFYAYRIGVAAATAVQTAHNAILLLTGTRYVMLNGVLIAVRTATIGATIAQLAMNTAMKANPIGLVVGAIGALVTALGFAHVATQTQTGRTNALNTAQQNLKFATDQLRDAENKVSDARLAREGSDIAVQRAQENLNRIKNDGSASSLDLREAEHNLAIAQDAAKDAAKRQTEAQGELHNKTLEVSRNKSLEAREQSKQDALSRTTSQIETQQSRLGALSTNLNALDGRNFGYTVTARYTSYEDKQAATGTGVPFKRPDQRALGGPVSAGKPYIVGENPDGSLNKTSELFVPKASGNIINSKDLQNALGGGSNVYNITLPNVQNAQDFAREFKLATAGRI